MISKSFLRQIAVSLVISFCMVSIALVSFSQAHEDAEIKVVWTSSIFQAGYTLLAGFDVNQNGKPEFLIYDKSDFTAYLFEAVGDDQYEVVWTYTWEGLLSADRDFWVADLNDDGSEEVIALVETDPQREDALQIFAWNGTEIERILTWATPRDSEGRIRPETFGEVADLDGDGVKELVIANRAGNGVGLMIVSLANKSYDEPEWRVEYKDDVYYEIEDGEKIFLKIHGLGIGDINNDGKKEIIVAADGRSNLRIYGVTSPNQYELLVQWVPPLLPDEFSATKAGIPIIDLNEDGTSEIFVFDNKSLFWVITDTAGEINGSWTTSDKWHKIIGRETWPESGEMRGGIVGDLDADGKLDFYVCANKTVEAVYDIEWVSGKGGDVTDAFNYEVYTILDEKPYPGIVRPAKIRVSGIPDLDGDGRQELIIISGSHSADAADKMLIVMEYEGKL